MSNIGHNSGAVQSVEGLSPADKKRLKGVIQELNDSMTRVSAEKDLQKEAINTVAEQLGLDKKLIRRMAKTYFLSSFNMDKEENSKFEEFYSEVVEKTIAT